MSRRLSRRSCLSLEVEVLEDRTCLSPLGGGAHAAGPPDGGAIAAQRREANPPPRGGREGPGSLVSSPPVSIASPPPAQIALGFPISFPGSGAGAAPPNEALRPPRPAQGPMFGLDYPPAMLAAVAAVPPPPFASPPAPAPTDVSRVVPAAPSAPAAVVTPVFSDLLTRLYQSVTEEGARIRQGVNAGSTRFLTSDQESWLGGRMTLFFALLGAAGACLLLDERARSRKVPCPERIDWPRHEPRPWESS